MRKNLNATLRPTLRRVPLLACLLFCSSIHAASLPAPGSTWKYLKGFGEASAPTDAWRLASFNDAAWASGVTPLRNNVGAGGTLLSDMVNNYSCVFMRQTFTLTAADIAAIPQLMLSMDY